MPEITIDDILMIEAHAHALLDHSRKLRTKLQGKEQKRMKRGVTPEMLAEANAQLERTMIRGHMRLEANKKPGRNFPSKICQKVYLLPVLSGIS